MAFLSWGPLLLVSRFGPYGFKVPFWRVYMAPIPYYLFSAFMRVHPFAQANGSTDGLAILGCGGVGSNQMYCFVVSAVLM